MRQINCSKHSGHIHIDTNISQQDIHSELDDVPVYPNTLLSVGAHCSVKTELHPNESADYCTIETTLNRQISGTRQNYEQYIRKRPCQFCCCCDRFLFANQVHHFGPTVNNIIITTLGFDHSTDLCVTCCRYLRSGKMPNMSSRLNSLEVDHIPNEIVCLTNLEKKILALIQVCMTVVLLPGCRYAERGLIVDLPRDVTPVIDQLSGLENLCLVQFDAGNPVSSSSGYLVNPIRVVNAFNWLKSNNMHFRNASVTSLSNFASDITKRVSEERTALQDGVGLLDQVTFAPVNYSVDESLENSAVSGASNRSSITVPRNSNNPVSVYEMPFGEEKAFPWLFPLGKFGYSYARQQKLKPSMYFRYRLYNRHGFWRKNITNILHAAVSYDKLCLKQDIGVCMKMYKNSRNNGSLTATTAADVRSRGTNPDIIQNSYMFMKHIRGTVAYFRNALYDLLAMFRCLGPPTLFMTLSAGDLHWPELGMCLEGLSYEQAAQKSSFYTSMRSNPLITAIHFDRRFTALMQFVINGPLRPLGTVRDYFARVEYQNRGSPHYHIFWGRQLAT